MRFIGDIHGAWENYYDIIRDCEESIQVGDMGIFDEQGYEDLEIEPVHRFIRGNHDNPALCRKHPNYLGDFGAVPERPDWFFVSGAWSIDKDWRTPGLDWWPEEELGMEVLMTQTLPAYQETKPSVMITHDCPIELLELWCHPIPTRTGQALQAMYDAHKPDIWIFGHHHAYKDFDYQGTRFICLDCAPTEDLTQVYIDLEL